MNIYKVNYTYRAGNKLRSGSLIVDAIDLPGARKAADAELAGATAKIGKIKLWASQAELDLSKPSTKK